MEIYLLEQNICTGYATYDSVVVCAENESNARTISPDNYVTHFKDGNWMGTRNDRSEYENNGYDWVMFKDIDKIKVTHIGKANELQKRGVILSSFNAG